MFWEFESSVIRGHARRYLFDIAVFRASNIFDVSRRSRVGQGRDGGGDGARRGRGETDGARTRTRREGGATGAPGPLVAQYRE